MTNKKQYNGTHIVMKRPNLLQLPALPQLSQGYSLRIFKNDDDLKPLASILSKAIDMPWDIDRVRTTLTQAPDVKAVYIVTWHKYPIATASSCWLPKRFPGSGIVHWLGVSQDHLRKGVASLLITRLLHDFADRGYKDALVQTDDFRIPAIRLYMKLGFLPVYEANGEDHRSRWSVIFQKMLNR